MPSSQKAPSIDLANAETLESSQLTIPRVQTDTTTLIRACPWYTGVPLAPNRTEYLMKELNDSTHPKPLLKLILVRYLTIQQQTIYLFINRHLRGKSIPRPSKTFTIRQPEILLLSSWARNRGRCHARNL
jgi:hypothetical protein